MADVVVQPAAAFRGVIVSRSSQRSFTTSQRRALQALFAVGTPPAPLEIDGIVQGVQLRTHADLRVRVSPEMLKALLSEETRPEVFGPDFIVSAPGGRRTGVRVLKEGTKYGKALVWSSNRLGAAFYADDPTRGFRGRTQAFSVTGLLARLAHEWPDPDILGMIFARRPILTEDGIYEVLAHIPQERLVEELEAELRRREPYAELVAHDEEGRPYMPLRLDPRVGAVLARVAETRRELGIRVPKGPSPKKKRRKKRKTRRGDVAAGGVDLEALFGPQAQTPKRSAAQGGIDLESLFAEQT